MPSPKFYPGDDIVTLDANGKVLLSGMVTGPLDAGWHRVRFAGESADRDEQVTSLTLASDIVEVGHE